MVYVLVVLIQLLSYTHNILLLLIEQTYMLWMILTIWCVKIMIVHMLMQMMLYNYMHSDIK